MHRTVERALKEHSSWADGSNVMWIKEVTIETSGVGKFPEKTIPVRL